MKLLKAKSVLQNAGFNVTIDTDTDGLTELSACKNNICEVFYDSTRIGFCSTYLCEFDSPESIVKYADKSILLAS